VLGTSLEIRWTEPRNVWGRRGLASRELEERIEAAVLGEIHRLELIFSTYREDSELCRWQAAGSLLPVSKELAEVLERAAAWRDRTRGAFDPTCGVATRPITLDAIAKGYIVDRAALVASVVLGGPEAGDVVVNIGGDIRHVGNDPVEVAVADPFRRADNAPPLERIRIAGRGIATSGPFHRGRWEGGTCRSHIVDPRTGEPADHMASVTVVAPSAEDADALATAFNVLSPDESLALARDSAGVECLLLCRDGRRYESAGWSALQVGSSASRTFGRGVASGPLLTRRQLLSRMATAGSALLVGIPFAPSRAEPSLERKRAVPWDERFELALTFQIGDPRAGLGLRRPYVATYVETPDGTSVRTISLWSQKAQWIREMRRWYRGEGVRRAAAGGPSLIDTVTQPTRPPGTYTVVWDGRNDQGALVEQGEYVIYLESVRQGSSSFVTQQAFTFGTTPFQATMADYAGFSGIQLDFRERQ
jgi:thiamine biosynthesis lipoprotein ApbE